MENQAADETVIDHRAAVVAPITISSTTSTRIKPVLTRLGLLLPCCTCFAVCVVGGRILLGLYYRHGGSHKWFSCWLMTIGFPLLSPLLYFLCMKEASEGKKKLREVLMEPKLFVFSAALGLSGGLGNYMYMVGMSNLPVSTASLLISTQLAFTSFFSFIFVKQKFTFYSINAVALMILGALALALHTSGDRPEGVGKERYVNGFLMALGAAALGGLTGPLVELSYLKSRKPISYAVAMQFQFLNNAFAAIFSTSAVFASKDLLDIPREAREYALGEVKYYMVLILYAIVAQVYSACFMGILYCTSSLFLGIFNVAMLPITQIIAAITLHEKYTTEKAMSLALCLWGFTSYFVGVHSTKSKTAACTSGTDNQYSPATVLQVDPPQQVLITESVQFVTTTSTATAAAHDPADQYA